MPAKLSPTTLFLLAALLSVGLSACGPRTPEAAAQVGETREQITAAKSRVPYQYRAKEPLNLLDYRVNLNPDTNRSSP